MISRALRTIHSFLVWTIGYLIIIILGLLILGSISLFRRDKKGLYHWGGRVWAGCLLFSAGIKKEVRGAENIPREGNFIFAANHSSTIDIPLLVAAIPRRFLFVIREKVFRVPFLGRICANAGHLCLHEKDPKQFLRDAQNIVDTLKGGESVLIFPEGRRRQEIEEFKSGVAKIALESGRPVIPVAISGSYELLPPKSFVFRPGRVRVSIGKPLRFEATESYREVCEKIREAVANLLEKEGKGEI